MLTLSVLAHYADRICVLFLAAPADMTRERLLSILRYNSWGSLHSELGVTEARKEKLHSLIGELACCACLP